MSIYNVTLESSMDYMEVKASKEEKSELKHSDVNKITANYLKDIIKSSDCVLAVFGEQCNDIANVCVKNDRVVYLQRHSPISNKYKVIQSPLLNSFQDLILYLENPSSNFEGLCTFMDDTWSMCDCDFYRAFCDFLTDVKMDRTESIEQVLNGEKKYCYTELFRSVPTPAINNLLYHALYNLLKKEDFNPLFMFVCQNFYMECSGQTSLTAYGRSIDGILLNTESKPSKLVCWVNDHRVVLKSGFAKCLALCGSSAFSLWLGLLMLSFTFGEYTVLQVHWLIPIGVTLLLASAVLLLFTSALTRIYNKYVYSCEQTFLKGGWQCFLQMEMPIRESKYYNISKVVRGDSLHI